MVAAQWIFKSFLSMLRVTDKTGESSSALSSAALDRSPRALGDQAALAAAAGYQWQAQMPFSPRS